MNINRSSGVLLHPTALPNPFGIGDFGLEAYKFTDFLAKLKQEYWQILPLTIPEKGNSPYSPLSSFAGNPLLISLEKLVEDNFLQASDLESLSSFQNKIDYSQVKEEKEFLLKKAFTNFSADNQDYANFCKHHWLEDYSLFITLYEKNEKKAWSEWSEEEKNPTLSDKNKLIAKFNDQVNYHKFVQFIFHKQWLQLKNYANQQNIQIVGDIPIYVSYNSADVWANKQLFQLDEDAKAQFISGCPPDDFNHNGQIWENPLYDWEENKKEDYKWWKERIGYNLEISDIVRLDHFIGFTRYWSIPSDLFDAKLGEWKQGPGEELFISLEKAIPNLNILAEDLGSLTKEVTQLKDNFNFPGMLVLHYSLDDHKFNTKNDPYKTFIYTGTHDNNTTKGWWNDYAHKHNLIKENLYKYLAEVRETSDFSINQDTIAFDLIEVAYSSNCLVAMVPLQDFLNLGDDYRMNRPGFAEGNWDLRIPHNYAELINQELVTELMRKYNRIAN